VTISAPEGYQIADVSSVSVQEAEWTDGTLKTVTEEGITKVKYALKNADGRIAVVKETELKKDITSPTGKIMVGSTYWNIEESGAASEDFIDIDKITYDDTTKDTTKYIKITVSDVGEPKDINTVSFYAYHADDPDQKMTKEQIQELEDKEWKEITYNSFYSGYTFTVGAKSNEDGSGYVSNDHCIVYVKITDKAGNEPTYISSNGFVLNDTENTENPGNTDDDKFLGGNAGDGTGGDNSSSGGDNNLSGGDNSSSGGDNSSSGGDSNLSGGSNSIGGGSNSSGGDGIVNDQNDKKNDGTTSDSESGSSSGMNFINIPGNDTAVTPEPTTHEGTITTSAIIQDGSPITGVEIATSTEKLKSKSGIFTLIEQKEIEAGKNARVWAVVSATDLSNLTKKEIEEITDETEAIMGEGATPLYFDLTLWVQVDGEAARQVYETGDEIAINIEIPASIVSNAKRVIRTYNVIRLHNGDVSVLSGKLVDTVSKIRFRTDRFSTYAIAYTDLTDLTTELSVGGTDGNTGADPGTTGTDNTKPDDSNKSDDDSNKPGDSNQPNDSNGSNKNSNNGSNNGKNNGTNEQKNAGNSNQQNNTDDPGTANSQIGVDSNSGTGKTTTPVVTQSDGKQVTAASGSKTVTGRQKDNEPKTGDAGRTGSSAATAIVLADLLCLAEILQRKRKIN
jgi:hypothetical protein